MELHTIEKLGYKSFTSDDIKTKVLAKLKQTSQNLPIKLFFVYEGKYLALVTGNPQQSIFTALVLGNLNTGDITIHEMDLYNQSHLNC